MIDKNTPAFPCPVGHIECAHPVGMNYRQWLIGMALQGLVSSNFYDRYQSCNRSHEPVVEVAASIAIEYADAIIDRLNKEDK